MALVFSSGMTVDDTAQAITNWGAVPFVGTIDHGPVAITSHGAMGPNCMGLANSWSAADNAALMYDYFTSHASTALDLTAVGNEVLAIWFSVADVGLEQTLANGGVYIIASSSTDVGATVPTAYRRWYVSGSDVLATRDTASGPWYLAMIDTRKAASVADVGAFSLTTVHRYGIGTINAVTLTVGGPPPENLLCGGVMHGRPIYQLTGDGTTTATWANFVTHSVTTQQNGLIEDKGGGVLRVSCGFRFGKSTQAATTTFSDATGQTFIFKRQTYYNAGVVDALNYSDYYLVDADGASGFKTSVTLGSVVGAGDARQGVGGGAFVTGDQTNVTFKADFATNIANLTAVNMSGVRWIGAKGGLKFDDNTKTVVVTNAFQRSGEVDCGTTGNGAVLLNSTVTDPEGGTANNYGLRLPSLHNIKRVGFITSGTPVTQHMLDLTTGGTYTVTMDKLEFFGDYSSATIWHGDMSSATAEVVTGAATNGANPIATEFSKTGNAGSTIAIQNSVTLTVTVKDVSGAPIQNTLVAIYKAGNILAGQEIVNALTDASGVVTAAFNYSVNQAIVIRLRNSGGAPQTVTQRYFPIDATGTITTNGYSASFTMLKDPIAAVTVL